MNFEERKEENKLTFNDAFDILQGMKTLTIIVLALLPACISAVYGKETLVEDCVTRHLKVVSNKEAPTGEFYEKIVDSCKNIYTGRP